jgi:glutamyl-tRNA reductase
VDPSVPELWLLGVDFATAPLAVREPLSYTPDAARDLLRTSVTVPGLQEAVIVSTCNRTEFYLAIDPVSDAVSGWLGHVRRTRPAARIGDEHCVLVRARGMEAARHLFRVSCGLESSILGDVHIGGQLKQAVALSGDAGRLGPFLSRLFQHAFRSLTVARSETEIGRGHASLGSAVAGLITGRRATGSRILLIGGGVAARDIGRQLAKWRAGALTFVNRTREKADELACQLAARSASWDTLAEEIAAADVVIAATSAAEPVVRQDDIARCLARRGARPPLFIDVGVPRNVEPIDGIEYLTIDDIGARRDAALAQRRLAVPLVEAIIERELESWARWVWTRPGENLIKRVFAEERRQRAALVDTLVAAGCASQPTDLNRLIARAWGRMLHQHATGLRRWLKAAPAVASDAIVEPGRLDARISEGL